MNPARDVLDKGYIILTDHMGSDLTVARRARHNPDADWRDTTKSWNDERLINYLMRHKHTSPFEFVEFDFHVKLPIFVARQWMRHRTWNFNEVSGRYQELGPEFYVPSPHAVGTQSSTNHQSRAISGAPNHDVTAAIDVACEQQFRAYEDLLEKGCPRELARIVLPLATYTEVSAKVDLHNLFHFLRLRSAEDAQYEIRVYAEAILELITPIVPVCVNAWKTYG